MHAQEVGMVNQIVTTQLEALQARFGIIDLSGEIRVVDLVQIKDLLAGSKHGDPAMYKKGDAVLMMKRHLEGLPISGNTTQVITNFWVSPETVMFTATAFSPLQQPASVLNFWVDPSPAVKAGNWVKIRDFIRDIVCAGNDDCYEYLIRYMAHMLQHPEEKPGVILALIGGQGIGKGMYFNLLRAIWPRTSLLVSDMEQVTGRFNSCLERNYIICLDEAMFAGDRRAMDRLKSIVTEPRIQIEQKFQPARSIDSVHRLITLSNHDHIANVERDDRRFVFLRVSDFRKQDISYFRSLAGAISDSATIGALVYYLARKDLTSFEVRQRPRTGEHLRQKLKSLQGFERYWYEVLMTGFFAGIDAASNLDEKWESSTFVATSTLVSAYGSFNKNAQRHQTVQSSEVAMKVRRLCPSAENDRQVCRVYGNTMTSQLRGLKLPAVAIARAEFEAFIGGEVPWE
jgi:hypothetical protein